MRLNSMEEDHYYKIDNGDTEIRIEDAKKNISAQAIRLRKKFIK